MRSLLRTSSRPDIAETPIYCKALDCEIPAGAVIGFTDVDEVTTREGIRLRLEMTGKVYAEGRDRQQCLGGPGEQPTGAHPQRPPGYALHDLRHAPEPHPQLLAAAPGYLTIDSLPRLRYQQSYVG